MILALTVTGSCPGCESGVVSVPVECVAVAKRGVVVQAKVPENETTDYQSDW